MGILTRVAFWKRDAGAREGGLERNGTPLPAGYVGRTAELARFEENLTTRERVVVSVTGEYGLGKTDLLRRFQLTATVNGQATASVDTSGKALPTVLASLADQLEQRGARLRSFSEQYRTYRHRMSELEADPQAPKGLATLAAGTLAKGGVRAARHIPVAGFAFELVSEEAAATVATEITNYVLARIGDKDEVELVLEPVPTLTRLFLSDLHGVAEQQPVCLFLDADDASFYELEGWLFDVVDGRHGKRPSGLLVTVAGTRELDQAKWVRFEAQIDRITLGPLSDADSRLFLAQAGVTNEAVVEEILRRSGGIPLSLAVLAAQRPEHPEQVGDPNGSAVEGFLSSVGEPMRRRLAVDGSVPRLLNRDVLGVVLARDDVLDDFVWLTALPFMTDTENGWVYSNPVREQLLLRSHRDAPQSWTKLQRTLAKYYGDLANELALDEDERPLDAEWQRYELEAMYHALCGRLQAARPKMLNGFMAAFAGDRRFAQRYGEAIRQAGADLRDDRLAQLGDLLARGTAAIDAGSPQDAIAMLGRLIDSGELEDRWRAKALDWRGFLTIVQGQYEASLADFDAALELQPDSVEFLLDRARALQQLGRHQDALRDLDRAASVEPENPLVFMLRGETNQLADRLDEALADAARVLELQPGNAAAWVLQADVQQLKGDLEPARESLDRALEIEPDNAATWAARGRVQQASGRLEEALQDLERAAELAPDDYGILALRANLLSRSGRIEEAAAGIRDLITRAQRFFDEYGTIVASMPSDEFQRRSARFASLAGLDGREAARQVAQFSQSPEAVIRALEADLAGLDAMAKVKSGDLEGAIADYGRALELDHERANLWASRAGALGRAGRTDEAFADLDKAIELDPGQPAWLITKAQAELQRGNVDEAGTVFDRAVESAPYNAQAWAARAQFRLGQTLLDEALADIDRAIALAPTAYAYVSVRGLIFQAKGDPAGAAECARILAENAEAYVDQVAAASELARFLGDRDGAVREVRGEGPRAEGLLLRSQGDLEGAIEAWNRALEIAGPKAPWLFERGELRRVAGHLEEALSDFDQMLELDPGSGAGHGSRGQALRALDRSDEALAELDRALELDDTLVWAFLERGELHRQEGRLELALADYDQIIELDPESATGHGSRGQALRALGRSDEALAELDRALELDGTMLWAVLERGQLHHEEGRLELALADYDRSLELDPESAFGHGRRGQALRALGRDEEALAAFDRALELDDSLIWAFLERGELHRLAGRLEPALADFDRMIELQPETAIGHGIRGQVLRALGRTEEALVALDRALELDDTLAWARRERGELYVDSARFEEAEAEFSRVLAGEPDDLEALVGRGNALVGLGRFENALADLEQAIALAPGIAYSYGIRGEIHYMLRHHEPALADFERATQLMPEWSWAQSRLSEVLLLSGRADEGLAAIQAAREVEADDDWMRYLHGLANEAVGNSDDARRDFDEAIAAAVQHAQNGDDRSRHLLNAAVYRLARNAPGDVDEAKRLFAEVAPASDSHRRNVIRDLETLSSVRKDPTAATIAAGLASG
jgi:tetratricopeptide (TPR) repeat protein